MKTILIAPTQTDLAMAPAEIQDVANLLGADLILGVVDLARVFRELSKDNGGYELIWFASHGDDFGIHLSDNVIDGDTLAAALRGTRARLIMLNTCSSERAAEQIYSATSVPVICNVGPVADAAAYATARRFAYEIAGGLDVVRAFALAKTKTFRLIPDDPAMYSAKSPDVENLTRRIDTAEKTLKDHHDLLFGRPGENGIVYQMARLTDRLGEIRIILWIVILMFAAMLGTLAVLVNYLWTITL